MDSLTRDYPKPCLEISYLRPRRDCSRSHEFNPDLSNIGISFKDKNITHDVLRLADLVRCPVALLLGVIVDGGVGVC